MLWKGPGPAMFTHVKPVSLQAQAMPHSFPLYQEQAAGPPDSALEVPTH